jgi:hypothetical protein
LCDPKVYADPTVLFRSTLSTVHATINRNDIYTPIHNAVLLQCSYTGPCNKRFQIVYHARYTHSRNRDKTRYFTESSLHVSPTFPERVGSQSSFQTCKVVYRNSRITNVLTNVVFRILTQVFVYHLHLVDGKRDLKFRCLRLRWAQQENKMVSGLLTFTSRSATRI